MARQIFISYSRVDTDHTERLIKRLNRTFPDFTIWYDSHLHSRGGQKWWDAILDAIEASDIFLYLLSNESLESPYCQAEFKEAQRLKRPFIAVQLRDRTKIPDTLADYQYIDLAKRNQDYDPYDDLVASINRLLVEGEKAKRRRFSQKDRTPKPVTPEATEILSRPDTETPPLVVSDTESRRSGDNRTQYIIAAIGAIVALIAAIINIVPALLDRRDNYNATQTALAVIQVVQFDSPTPTETSSATQTPSYTPISATDVEETIRAEMVTIQAEQRQTQAAIEATVAEAERLATAATANALTQIAESWTDTPTPNLRATAETRSTQDAQATINAQATVDTQQTRFAATLNAQRTQTEIAHSTDVRETVDAVLRGTARAYQLSTTTARIQGTQQAATENAHATDVRATVNAIGASNTLNLALNGVESNSEWIPFIYEFERVEMVLVPKGCFSMGSSVGDNDERPVSEFCIDAPFWIDRYEVSNALFRQLGGMAANSSRWGDPNLPREIITWDEASEFCKIRDARLPTEAEWEYAASGPDNLAYPWGNVFDRERLNFCDSTCNQNWANDHTNDGYAFTAPIDTFPNGVSWVGAYNMSGNVSEWVSTLYNDDFAYPYATNDGRENTRANEQRVLRGGAWDNTIYASRVASRTGGNPNFGYSNIGFRCARDY